MNSASPAFQATDLTRRYGAVTALDRVNLTIPLGAFVLLVGANGAGKTTLLHLFLHLTNPTSGTIRVLGHDATAEDWGARSSLGYVPESIEWAFPRMKLGRMLAYHAAYRPTWDAAYAHKLATSLDLKLDRRISGLSKGELRRAQIVAALAHRPEAILLDELTDGLDPLVRRRVLELLAEHLTDHPATVLASTHQMHELEGLATGVALMHEGRLIGNFTRDELRGQVHELVVRRPVAWHEPANWPGNILRREQRGLAERWTVAGAVEPIAELVLQLGGEVSEIRSLAMEDSVIALLEDAASAKGVRPDGGMPT